MTYYKKTIISKIATNLGIKVRKDIVKIFTKLIDNIVSDKIIDLGVTSENDPSANFLERMYLNKKNITCAGVQNCVDIENQFPGVRFVKIRPGERLPFCDKEFDYLYSNAVIEHVGSRSDQIFFVNECLRISKNFFITTPNKWFPLEMHTHIPFIHYLPPKLYRFILKVFGDDFYCRESNLNLLDRSSLLSLFPKHIKVNIKYAYLGFLPSNLIAYGVSTLETDSL